jgi:hypothetical protein
MLLDVLKFKVGFPAEQRIEPHTLLSVELPSPDPNSLRKLMSVRSATAVSPGVWRIGCEFRRRLGSGELLPLLSGQWWFGNFPFARAKKERAYEV